MIISDYVPSLSFITKLQGWEPYLLEIQKRGRAIVHKVIDVESHRQRVTDVPDFVDVLLKAPLDDAGKPLSDGEIMSLLLVSIRQMFLTGAKPWSKHLLVQNHGRNTC